ncbi:hypothetical protein VP01_1337g3 [Puccinia sorghi]|uniref:Uncharacterized protein n=1 Tax=Puccinia sorghi TaxID=27349 RepID=A0A0L6VMC5_9BASI|nr:hypothetical protein VP01_1337g3 [Puccinia sorghi]
MLHLIRTLFSVVFVLAFTVVASPVQLGALVQSGLMNILDLEAIELTRIDSLTNCDLLTPWTLCGLPPTGEPNGLAKRFQPIRPEASAPRPWIKTARSLHRSRGRKEAPEETAEKSSSQQSSRGFSKVPRRPDADIATSHHTTGLSNPRPWARQEEAISSSK